MHLKTLQIHAAPGLPNGAILDGFAPGLNLLVGPNASGKSTAGRAMLASLGLGTPDPGVHAVLRWHDEGTERTASLFDGAVSGAPPGGPVTAPDASPWTLTLRDLLVADEAGFARQMTTELHAGFDVPALVDRYESAVKQPRALRGRVDDARRAEQQIAAKQGALAAEESRLAKLDAAITAAAGAPDEMTTIDAALAWHEAEREVAVAEAALDGFDAVHARLPEGFVERLADHDRAIARAEQDARSARDALEGAREALDRLGPAGVSFDRAAADALDERVRAIAKAAERDAQQSTAHIAAQAALDAAHGRAGLLGDATAPTLADLEALETSVRAESDARTRLAEARSARERLPTLAPSNDLAALRDAVVVLRQWLQSHRAAAPEAATGGDRRLAIAAGIAALVVLVVGVVTGGLAAGFVGAVALVGVALWAWPRPRANHAVATPPTWSFAVDPPAAWTVDEVSGRLLTLLGDVAEREVDRARADQLAALRAEADRQLEDAEHRAREATTAVATWLQSHGLDPRLARAGAVELAHRLRAIADAEAALAIAAATADDARGDLDRAWDAWSGACDDAGAPWTRGRDVTDARAHAGRVRADAEARARADQAVHAAERAAHAADEAVERATAARDQLFEAAGFADDERAAVRACFATHAAWRDADADLRDARRAASRARAAIDHRADLVALPVDALRDRRIDAEARADDLEGLMAERATLREKLEQALEGTARADAAGAVEHACAELADRRDEAMVAAAAAAMARHVADQLDRTAVPDTLQRAQDRFAAFTRNAWALVLRPDRSLGAQDQATGVVRGLDALSDATRVQLLLATRIARIEQIEGGTPRPLFIDEALTTTDPLRFAAIADALAALADGGRQVIYATAAAADVAAWHAWAGDQGCAAPAIVETGSIGGDRTWRTDRPGAPAPTTPVPAPHTDEAPAAWFARAGVALPGPHDPASAWPAAVLLYDRLDDAAALLRERVGSVGQTRAIIESDADWLPLDAAARRRFVTRARLLEATVAALSIGRHRPVDWPAVDASEAVTSTFEDRVRALLPSHGHDAAAFAAAVRDLKGFRTASADQLDAYLRDAGYIDDRDPLDPVEIVARVRAAAGADAEVDGGAVEAFVTWVSSVLGPGAVD